MFSEVIYSPSIIEARNRFVDDPLFRFGEVALKFVRCSDNAVLLEHRGQKLMQGASIQKLLTTSAALDCLSEDHQFCTRVGMTGAIKNGTLNGNLIVQAGGDMTFCSRAALQKGINHKDNLFSLLNRKGIHKVSGSIILDSSVYHNNTVAEGTTWQDLANYYGASPCAFMVSDNSYDMLLDSCDVGEQCQLTQTLPDDFPYDLYLDVKVSHVERDQAYFSWSQTDNRLFLEGTIPAHKKGYPVGMANPFSTKQFLDKLASQMQAENVFESHTQVPSSSFLGSIGSLPLNSIVKTINLESHCLFADALCINIDPSEFHKSYKGGVNQVQSFVRQECGDITGLKMVDGSGISAFNRLSADCVVQVLNNVIHKTWWNSFKESLSISGTSGTLQKMLPSKNLSGRIVGKSGTLSAVKNVAGYIMNKNQPLIAFCVFVNQHTDTGSCLEVNQRIEQLLADIILECTA